MRPTRPKRNRRGVSLILALFTTVVLLTLSIAFIALAIGEARTSRRAAHTIVAQSAASWAVQATMNFMGRGGNLILNSPVGSISPFMVVRADAGGPHAISTSGGGIDVAVSNPPGATNPNARRLTFVNATNPGGSPVVVGEGFEQLRADVFVDVEPVLATYGKNQANPFALTATAQVYDAGGELISNRVVEARIAIADDFTLENAMAWDAQGAGIGTPAMANKIFIPNDYDFSGSLYVTGASDNAQPWASTAGKLQFETAPPPDEVAFIGPVRINATANVGPTGAAIDPSDLEGNFAGGASYAAPYYPFVGENAQNYFNTDRNGDGNLNRSADTSGYVFGADTEERGLFFAAAVDSDSSKSGYEAVSRFDIENANELAPRLPDLNSATPVALQNYTPVLPEVEVVLRADDKVTINVWNTNQGDGGIDDKTTGLMRSRVLELEDLEAGTIYVEGGNAVVRTALADDVGHNGTGEFAGQISIAAGENPQREPLNQRSTRFDPAQYGNYSESIYHDAAALVFREVQRRSGIDDPTTPEPDGEPPTITLNGENVDNPNFISPQTFVDRQLQPPYTRAEVNQLATEFGLTVDTSDMVDTVPRPGGGGEVDANYWPPPAPGVEREGNLVIGGDIETDDAGSSIVGLYAQNFLLLNDRTVLKKADPKTLKVEAALMSFEHSLQLDWDNTGKNRVPGAYDTVMAQGFDGTFVLNGLIQSRYSDVEGSTTKQGYYNQKISYNQALKYISTPTEPIFDPGLLSNQQVSIPWQVIQYIDKGSINTLFSS